MSNLILNNSPALTWTWLRMNKARIEDDLNSSIDFSNAEYNIISKPESVKIIDLKDFSTKLKTPLSAVFNKTSELGIQYKSVEEENVTELSAKDTLVIQASKKETDPIVINVKAKGNTASNQIIHALSGSEVKVILISESENDEGVNLIRTKCYAEQDSKIHICKVQLLKNGYYHIDSTENVCGENATVVYTELQLGAKSVYTGSYTDLSDYKASYKSDTAYFRKGNQKIDMNYVCCHNHQGKKTNCSMSVAGTLKEDAAKIYRGTIDFKKGCCGAKGNEIEETLLLSPKAVNRSIPMILCDEEDVEGEHGATIGRLNDDMLFYMQTRGIPKNEAERMISRAKIIQVANLIDHACTMAQIEDYLDKEAGL